MTTDHPQPAYRWIIVAAAALILAITMGGLINGISAYVIPLQEAYGWNRGAISLINFWGIIGLALGGIVVGAQADRYGARPLIFFGAIMLGLCYLLASRVTELWQMYTLFFVGGFLGGGAIYAPTLALAGNWFRHGSGLALGLISAGQALGQGFFPYLSSLLITAYGTSVTLAVTGAVVLVGLLSLALLMAPPPAATVGPASADTTNEAYPIPVNTLVLKMSAASILCCVCMSVPLIHLVPLVQDICAASLADASSVAFVMLLVAIGGRIFFGKLADMIGPIKAYMTATAWMTLLVFGFLYMSDIRGFTIYAVIYGFGYGGVMTGILATMRILSSPARRTWAFSMVTGFALVGHAIGGYQGGLLHDLTGNYTAAYAVAAIAGVINLFIVSTLLPRRNRPLPASA